MLKSETDCLDNPILPGPIQMLTPPWSLSRSSQSRGISSCLSNPARLISDNHPEALWLSSLYSGSSKAGRRDGYFCELTRLGHRVPRYLAKHYFWECLESCIYMRFALQSADSEKQIALLSVGEYYSICWQHRQKRWRKNSLFLPDCGAGTLVFSGPRTWTRTNTNSSSGSWVFAFGLRLPH